MLACLQIIGDPSDEIPIHRVPFASLRQDVLAHREETRTVIWCGRVVKHAQRLSSAEVVKLPSLSTMMGVPSIHSGQFSETQSRVAHSQMS